MFPVCSGHPAPVAVVTELPASLRTVSLRRRLFDVDQPAWMADAAAAGSRFVITVQSLLLVRVTKARHLSFDGGGE